MKKLSCFQSFEANNRFAYFAAGGEKPAEAQKPSEVPEAGRLTPEHIDQVLRAVDNNIHTVEQYYADYIIGEIRGIKMPEAVKKQVNELKQLRYQLEAARNNPSGSKNLLTKIYSIISELDTSARKVTRAEKLRQGDPLATWGYSIVRPELTPGMTRKEKREARLAQREAKEQQDVTRFNEAVRIFVSGGPMEQKQLDAVKAQFAREGGRTIARAVPTERGMVDVYMTLSQDGTAVNVKGVIENPRRDAKAERAQLAKAQFDFYMSLNANEKTAPKFDVPPVDTLVQRVASSGKKLQVVA